MSQLTDFQILQLAATLASAGKQDTNKNLVKRMFDISKEIKINLENQSDRTENGQRQS